MKVELIRWTDDPKDAMALAGSVCYDSVPRQGIVDHCFKSGHHSIMEFAVFHFYIEGVSRALTHQLVRHRVGASYAQRSQRYVKEDNFEYVKPQSLNGFEAPIINFDGRMVKLSYDEMVDLIQCFYNNAVENGIPAEDARYILPNACASKIHVQMDFRELMNFMNLRLCTHAQWEIRQLAKHMKVLVVNNFPELETYLVPKCMKHPQLHFCDEKNGCGLCPKIEDIAEDYNWVQDYRKALQEVNENYEGGYKDA